MQLTWMPHNDELSGEVHGVAKNHEETVGADIKAGEAGERTCTGNDEEHRVRECIDDPGTEMTSCQVNNKATDTLNPHVKCTGPTRPVSTLHDPANECWEGRIHH
jgi:hypothetical protein